MKSWRTIESKWIIFFAGVAKLNLYDDNLLISQGLLSTIFFFLPGFNVKCKVLKDLGEGDTRGMYVSSFKLLSSFLCPISLFWSTGLCQLWKVKRNPLPEGQYCLNWSFKQIFYTSLSWVIKMGEDSMGDRRRKVYIIEQEIKMRNVSFRLPLPRH